MNESRLMNCAFRDRKRFLRKLVIEHSAGHLPLNPAWGNRGESETGELGNVIS